MRVLLALDQSNQANAVIDLACELLSTSDELFLITVCEPVIAPATTGPKSIVVNFDHLNEENETKAMQLLKEKGRLLKQRGYSNFRCRLNKGFVKDCIIEEIKNLDIDLLIMGKRGMGFVQRALTGYHMTRAVYLLIRSELNVVLIF